MLTHLNNLAGVVKAQGRYAEAEPLYREALEIDRKTIGAAHPDATATIAGVEATLPRRALPRGAGNLGEGHPNYATRLNNLARGAGTGAGMRRPSRSTARRWRSPAPAIGEAHPDYAIHLVNLGSLLGQTDRVAEGRGMLEQALTIFRAALPPDHPHIADTQRHLDALPDG